MDDEVEDHVLKRCLDEIGLSTLHTRFKEENIDHKMIESLSDNEMVRMGIQTIGDRHRLRAAVRAKTETASLDTRDTTLSNGASASGSSRTASLAREIYAERTTLFGPYGGRPRSRPNSRIGNGNGKRKRGRTWTANFVCLAQTDVKTVPNSTEREILRNAGLGPKK